VVLESANSAYQSRHAAISVLAARRLSASSTLILAGNHEGHLVGVVSAPPRPKVLRRDGAPHRRPGDGGAVGGEQHIEIREQLR